MPKKNAGYWRPKNGEPSHSAEASEVVILDAKPIEESMYCIVAEHLNRWYVFGNDAWYSLADIKSHKYEVQPAMFPWGVAEFFVERALKKIGPGKLTYIPASALWGEHEIDSREMYRQITKVLREAGFTTDMMRAQLPDEDMADEWVFRGWKR